MIFVFGSNLAGIHGAGAALFAAKFQGAVNGVGVGLFNRSYAIPTKDCDLKVLPLRIIRNYAAQFLDYAMLDAGNQFKVTRIGCGLAGYLNEEIAPMFKDSPTNCSYDTLWQPWLGDDVKYWGTQ